MGPYHHHMHYGYRRGPSFFKGILLVGLGFWIARATERRRLACDSGSYPSAPPSASPSAGAETSRGPWGHGGWCRRRAEQPPPSAQPTASAPEAVPPVAYGTDTVHAQDVGAVMAALAAYQQRATELSNLQTDLGKPAPSDPVPSTEATPVTPSPTPAAPVDVKEQASLKRKADLEKIERLGAALERMKAALIEDSDGRMV